MIKKMRLPYSPDIFGSILSEETFNYHYGKHYVNYLNKLNDLIKNTEFENLKLKDIIKKSDGNIFNNAAQVWNHEFYWMSISKESSEDTKKQFFSDNNESEIETKKSFINSASKLFGSGWCWFIKDDLGKFSFVNTKNANNLIQNERVIPLFVCDVWEHAYYIDYRNDRLKYLNSFWDLINWKFVKKNLSN